MQDDLVVQKHEQQKQQKVFEKTKRASSIVFAS